MGQQQLLLVVLGIVVLGIGIVVGIAVYNEQDIRQSYDTLTKEALYTATEVQRWQQTVRITEAKSPRYRTHSDFEGVNFNELRFNGAKIYGSEDECFENIAGIFMLEVDDDHAIVRGYSPRHANAVTVRIYGRTDSGIVLDRGETAREGRTIEDGSVYDTTVPGNCAPATPAG
ncbi:MAG: hypothetical protein AAF752_02005 [Bacteroidota bacterium]